jgi:adenylate kinase family enzyme
MSKAKVITPSGVAIVAPRFSIHQPLTPDQREIVFLIGPPCVGKSVTAKALRERGYRHYSSSTALRYHSRQSGIPEIEEQMNNGDIVSLKHALRVSEWEYRHFVCFHQKAVMDGWGREGEELEFAIQVLQEHTSIRIVILQASDSTLHERSEGRNRSDDALVKKRIGHFRNAYPGVVEVSRKYLPLESIIEIHTDDLGPDQVVSELDNRLSLARKNLAFAA